MPSYCLWLCCFATAQSSTLSGVSIEPPASAMATAHFTSAAPQRWRSVCFRKMLVLRESGHPNESESSGLPWNRAPSEFLWLQNSHYLLHRHLSFGIPFRKSSLPWEERAGHPKTLCGTPATSVACHCTAWSANKSFFVLQKAVLTSWKLEEIMQPLHSLQCQRQNGWVTS